MGQFKIAVLGAASRFGPSILKDVIVEHRLDGAELALVDQDRELADLLAAAGRKLAERTHAKVDFSTHTDRRPALDGAEFVLCAGGCEVHRHLEIDRRIISRHCPDHPLGQFGGIAGIAASLRQIAMVRLLAADMRKLCRRAWLLNLADPLPRVCQAAHEEGIATAGFCSASQAAHAKAWKILHGAEVPFDPPRSQLDLTCAGLNHFSWVTRLRDRQTGQDLYPDLRARLKANPSHAEPITSRILLETGYLPACCDTHVLEFLEPRESPRPAPELNHRTIDISLLRSVAEGRLQWESLLEQAPPEKPVDFIASIICNKPAEFPALNLVNTGQIVDLPRGLVVETPAIAGGMGPEPQRVDLPPAIRPMSRAVAAMNDLIVRAALNRSRRLVHHAINYDPTVLDKPAARAAIDECLAAHAELLGAYD